MNIMNIYNLFDDDFIILILLPIIAATWFIIIIISLIYRLSKKGNKSSDLREGKRGLLYLALGFFPITSILGFHILPMCPSKGARIFHLIIRFLLMSCIGFMCATIRCPKGSSCVTTLGALLVVPVLFLLGITYLFTVIETIITFMRIKE